jgi:hypothetical protein
MESILVTIRSGLGIDPEYDGFDGQIIMAINNAIFSLSQFGIGPDTEFKITGIEEEWTDLFDGVTNLESAKSYILLKVKQEFDPPGTSFHIAAQDRQIKELEVRLTIEVDPALVE